MEKLVLTLRASTGYLKTKKQPLDFTEKERFKGYHFSPKEVGIFLANLNKYKENLPRLYLDAFLLFKKEETFEIERKFIVNLDLIPKKELYTPNTINQFYTSFSPEVRFRKEEYWENAIKIHYRGDLCIDSGFIVEGKYIPVVHTKTKKGKGSLVREEKELNISLERYNLEQGENKKGNLIEKYRYNIHSENISFDKYFNRELSIMEKEFNSIEDATKFNIKEHPYILKEVTNDPRFKNGSIAKNGFPNLL